MAEMPTTQGLQRFPVKLAEMLAGYGFQGFFVLFPDNSNEYQQSIAD
jgi:hypothetical protein